MELNSAIVSMSGRVGYMYGIVPIRPIITPWMKYRYEKSRKVPRLTCPFSSLSLFSKGYCTFRSIFWDALYKSLSLI
jgi:hypothetical protein